MTKQHSAMPLGHQAGFSLVELMVTLALLGIISAMTLPNFLNQNKRAKTSALVAASVPAQTFVSDYYALHFGVSGLNCTTSTCVVNGNTISPDFLQNLPSQVSSITIQAGVVKVAGSATSYGQTINLYLVPCTSSGRLSWSCMTDSATTGLVPSNCTRVYTSGLETTC